MIALLCTLMAGHILLHPSAFPYTPDSASYFEQARTLLTDGAALETPYAPNHEARQPSRLFPIGYPVILASIGLAGIDPRDASLALTWAAALLLPILLFVSFRKPLGARYAVVLAAFSLTSPSTLSYSTLGTSDLLALLLAVATAGIVLNKSSRSWLVLAGVIGGGAYAVRNAQLALLLSIALYYGYLWFSRTTSRRETLRDAVAFGCGASLVCLPVLVRNEILFGTFNPYHMAPSTISALHNIRTFLQEMFYDLSGLRSLGVHLGWSAIGLLIMLCLAAGMVWRLSTAWHVFSPLRKNALILSATYAIISASVVIAARTRYEWGEMINIRHTLQITPFLWVIILGLLPDAPLRSSRWHAGIATLFLFIMGILHVNYAVKPRDLLLQQARGAEAIAVFHEGKAFLCPHDAATATASNWGYVFRIACNTGTRNIEMEAYSCSANPPYTLGWATECKAIAGAAMQTAHQLIGHPIKIGLFPGRGMDPGALPLSPNVTAQLEQSGFNINRNDAQGLLLSRQTR
ncbi:MAG TPA: hypothetical protein VIN38_13975 [Thiobacillus sp.]